MAGVVTVARGGKTLTRAGTTTLVLKFSRKAKRKLRSRRGLQGTLRVRTTALSGGSATVKNRPIRLRRWLRGHGGRIESRADPQDWAPWAGS